MLEDTTDTTPSCPVDSAVIKDLPHRAEDTDILLMVEHLSLKLLHIHVESHYFLLAAEANLRLEVILLLKKAN